MAISFSRPDPSSPAAVSTANFSTGRRGYEQAEVREFLRMVAAELARLQEREKFLERELRMAQRNSPNAAVVLDEEVVTRMLGEEAARILSTAREAASQIKVRAEEGASRVLREATDEAQRLREEAEIESARRRQDASSDAESELQMAKQQGREMVNEARAYRERVLGELARRRELARQQIEQLVHGRDRLLQAFERARLAAVDVMAEMTPLGEPSEYVNLSPTTGPVPLMVPAHELRPPAVDEEVAAEPESDEGEIASVVALFGGEIDADTDDAEADSSDEDSSEADSSDGEGKASVGDLFARLRAARADTVVQRPLVDEPVADAVAEAEAEAEAAQPADADAEADAEAAQPAEPEPEPEAEPVGDLEVVTDLTVVGEELSVFQVSPTAPTVVAEPDDSPFGRRDAELTPLIVASARKLKRVLADEQNDVLHILRRNDPVRALTALLPAEAEHVQRYAAAVDGELRNGALAGAASVDDGSKGAHLKAINRNKALQPAVDALLATIILPLRLRLERAVIDADGDNGELADTVRALYREWKTQRIDEHLDDVARMAFGHGALAALRPGTPVCWAVDPNGPACPDAEDNALAGVIGAGQPFPTDNTCAPAHDGCRCMLQHAPR